MLRLSSTRCRSAAWRLNYSKSFVCICEDGLARFSEFHLHQHFRFPKQFSLRAFLCYYSTFVQSIVSSHLVEMQLQALIFSSFLLLTPLLGVVRAYPQPLSPGIIASNGRGGTRPGGRKPNPKDGVDIPETSADLTGSDGTSSGEPESDIFHGPDGDGDSTCTNPLPENLLFSVEKGHDCIRVANIYNDQNTSPKFNCKTPAQQKQALCGEASDFGALAENCYDFLKQNHPLKAEAVWAYVGLCRQ